MKLECPLRDDQAQKEASGDKPTANVAGVRQHEDWFILPSLLLRCQAHIQLAKTVTMADCPTAQVCSSEPR